MKTGCGGPTHAVYTWRTRQGMVSAGSITRAAHAPPAVAGWATPGATRACVPLPTGCPETASTYAGTAGFWRCARARVCMCVGVQAGQSRTQNTPVEGGDDWGVATHSVLESGSPKPTPRSSAQRAPRGRGTGTPVHRSMQRLPSKSRRPAGARTHRLHRGRRLGRVEQPPGPRAVLTRRGGCAARGTAPRRASGP